MADTTRIILFSRLALPAAIVVWIAAMLASRLDLGPFGLVLGLHPAWYVAVILAAAGFLAGVACRRHSTLLTAYAFVLLAMLIMTAVLLERSPRFPYVYQSYAYGASFLSTGTIDYSLPYASWPGWHLVTDVMVGASGIDPHVMLTWIPVWLSVVTLIALMALMRRYRLPRYQRWVATALAVTILLSPVYPVPGSAALIIAVFLIAVCVEEYAGPARSARGRAAIVLLFAALVVTHLLTSLVGLLVVGALSVLIALALRRRPGPAVILGSALIAVYLLYVAVTVTTQMLPKQIEQLMDIDDLLGSILGKTSAGVGGGSVEHTRVVLVRIAYVVGLAGLAVFGALVALARRVPPRRWVLPAAWIAGGSLSLGVGSYGGEIFARAATLAAPGSLALASFLARIRAGRVLLAAAIVVGALASPVNLYGNEMFDYVRPAELAADAALAGHHPAPWNLWRRSRTWYEDTGDAGGGPFVVVYGPLFDRTSSVIARPSPPYMPFWSYDNGDLHIMVSTARPGR